MNPSRRHAVLKVAAGAGYLALGACASATDTHKPDASGPHRPDASGPRKPDASGHAEPAPVRGSGYRLVQNWDFTSTVTDLATLRENFYTRFIYQNGTLDHLNDEWERYRDNDNHVFEDGRLALVARAPNGVARGKIESGMLRSKWTGEYGYFECRMKAPPQRGMWPAFWLNPEDQHWPPEIDIVEIVNNGRDTTRNSFHYVHPGKKGTKLPTTSSKLNSNQTYKPPSLDYAEAFTTFAVDWTAERVRHYVNDQLVVDREYAWQHPNGTDGGPAHVLLNLAVGGAWPGPPPADGFPAKLLVDYMRVWQR